MIVYMLLGDLTPREFASIRDNELAISDIVLWELAKLVQLGRVELDLESPDFRSVLLNLTIIPIRLQIALASTTLDFSADPVDEIIAATSIVEKIPLLTRDRKIRRSRKVPLAL